MGGFLVSLLNLLGLILLVRLTLPERYLLLNPYAAAVDNLLTRLLSFLRAALPLSSRGLCLLSLSLTLSALAALAFRQGEAVVAVGAFARFAYPAEGFLGWLGVAALRFFGFYVALLSTVLFLRIWHLGRPLPGYTGDLMRLAARPLTGLPLWAQAFSTALAAVAFVALAEGCASGETWPMAQVEEVQALFERLGVPNVFDLSAALPWVRTFVLAGTLLVGVVAQAQTFMVMLLVALLLSRLLGAKPTVYFLADAVRLLTGPLPPFRLGTLDLSPVVAYFTLGLLSSLLTAGLLFASHVVQSL